MGKRLDLTNQKFGHLIAIKIAGNIRNNNKLYWECECICKTITFVVGSDLKSGHIQSCGCRGIPPRSDLSGQIFGKLQVQNANEKTNRFTQYWNCKCECEKEIVLTSAELKYRTHCGCGEYEFNPAMMGKDLINTKFNRLLVIGDAPLQRLNNKKQTPLVSFTCLCDCGSIICIPRCRLITGNTKSCGCLKQETTKENIKEAHKANIKYTPHIFSAKCVWWSSYTDGISFEDFYPLSQQNCFYCNSKPQNLYNWFATQNKIKSYLQNINDGNFIYNGLDRINSNLDHNINNVVSCCYICNMAKTDLSILDYLQHLQDIVNTSTNETIDFTHFADYINIPINTNRLSQQVYNEKYKDGNLSYEDFYRLSQMPCYYCSRALLNNRLTKPKISNPIIYKYNGLDRIDNTLPHLLSNVVPSCWRCNWTKSNLPINSFIDWIKQIKQNFNKIEVSKWV